MNIQWLLALRYLNGRKLRSFLTTLAVVFGVMVIFGMNILMPTMLRAFQATMLAGSDNVDLTVAHLTSEGFSSELVETVHAVDGVRVAQGLLNRPLNLPADFYDHDPRARDKVAVLSLVGVDPETARQMHAYPLKEGRFIQPGEMDTTVISASLADALGLKLGDRLRLPTTRGLVELTIVGIRPPRAAPGNEQVLVTLPAAQSMLNAAGKINAIEANFNGTAEAERSQVEQEIKARLGSDFQYNTLATGSELFASIRLAQGLFNGIGLLALFMGGFIIFNTFRTLVAERRRDIGMLRAVGASRRAIIGMILIEGLLQGSIGTLTGLVLGYLLVTVMLAGAAPFIEFYIHLRFGAPVVPPGVLLLSAALGIGITLLAGLLPALSAGRITPLEALRPSLAGAAYRRQVGVAGMLGLALIGAALLALFSSNETLIMPGALLFLVGLVLVAPLLVRPLALAFGALVARLMAREGTGFLAQGNLTRQPGRTAVTASTSMIALAILVVVGGIASALKGGFVNMLENSLGADYLFVPPAIGVWGADVGTGQAFTDQLKAIPGVGPVSSLRYASAIADLKPVMISKSQVTAPGTQPAEGLLVALMGIDPATFPQVSGLQFQKGQSAAAYAALAGGRGLIANGALASTAGLKVDDSVPLLTPAGRQEYRVVAIADDYMNVKVITAFISQANLAQDFQKTEDVYIQLNLTPGADVPAVEEQLAALQQAYPQYSLISGKLYLQQTKQLFNVAFVAMYVVFIFLTIPSLIGMLNTLAIGVLERTREIGMLRAVGATQAQVRRMVLAEALLLAAVGTAFGLSAGVYLCYAILSAFSLAGFPVAFAFPWNGLIYATLVSLLFGVLAAIIPARQAARLQIVQALRYE